jgi:phosphoglycolate phosphatase
LQRDLDELNMGHFFLATRTVDEAPSKPHPQMLLDLMDELGVRVEQTLMVGDTTYDLDMARNAGVDGVGVLTGGHDREALAASGAVACLDRLSDLPVWLHQGEGDRR